MTMKLLEALKLEERVRSHPLVKEWKLAPKNGTLYSDPWIWLEIDPINLEYKTRELQMNIMIWTRGGGAMVHVVWPHRVWKDGISDTHLTYTLERAMGLIEYLWNNHFLTSEGAYPNTVITMEVE